MQLQMVKRATQKPSVRPVCRDKSDTFIFENVTNIATRVSEDVAKRLFGNCGILLPFISRMRSSSRGHVRRIARLNSQTLARYCSQP